MRFSTAASGQQRSQFGGALMRTDFDKLSREEKAKRHDEAIRRAISNTPKQSREFVGTSAKSLKAATNTIPQSAPKGRLFRHQGR
jgi:hypothetical protein